MGKLRHQPFLGNHLDSNQFQKRRLAPVAVALGRVIEIREDALDILQIGFALRVQTHAVCESQEQGRSKMSLDGLDTWSASC